MGKAVGASSTVVWVDEKNGFRVLPRDHSDMTMDDICKQPRAVWNQEAETPRFELAGEDED